ncbi:MAG: isoprenoid biosynthesis glyoxalase ElbB [Candidatus Caenarcaniphilales bacterium]|nr:isoprenoid biosynthesis glyoxalase ElbB [Candidatus Caenarcaniphilales bacterium]
MKKAAVILCGCGAMDGSEIHEATFALLALNEENIEYQCFALDKPQTKVVNFTNGQELPESRNQLLESSRISRGKIDNIKNLEVSNFDYLVLPGGFGAAYNLCNFAEEKANASVDTEIERVIKDFHKEQKPIGAICISPVIVGLVLGRTTNPLLTAGDEGHPVEDELKKLGCKTQSCETIDCVIDQQNKIVSTPAYMNAKEIKDVREGIKKLTLAMKSL